MTLTAAKYDLDLYLNLDIDLERYPIMEMFLPRLDDMTDALLTIHLMFPRYTE